MEEAAIAARAAVHGSAPGSMRKQDHDGEETGVEMSDIFFEENNASQERCVRKAVIDFTSTKS